MSSSTRLVAQGWKLEDIPTADLAALMQISPGDAAARRKKLAEQQQDPAWIAQTLDALPAAVLAVLHLVVDAGGMAHQGELMEAAEETFGLTAPDCHAALTEAIVRLLVVPLRTHGNSTAIAMVLPAGLLIAPLVADLDLYELSASAFVAEDSPVRNPRMFLAACTAARHMDIKLTAENRPHRGATKRLAKQVGVDERALELMLAYGYDLRLLVLDGELLRPDMTALAEVAAGDFSRRPALAAASARVGHAPVPTSSLQRSVSRELGYFNVDVLEYLPGFELGVAGEVQACRARSFDGAVSGLVTPSFEVMLPPESRLVDIVAVGACCEWERLDRALVARITKASIARAVAGGANADAILAQLGSMSRHPIPQNVEAAIRDWAGSVVAAAIATGHVVVVDPGDRTRVAPLLTELAARELAPGVFLVRDREVRDITRVLGRANVMHRELDAKPGTLAVGAAPRAASPAASSATLATSPPSTAASASSSAASAVPASASSANRASAAPAAQTASQPPEASRHRARVSAWRRGEPFEGRRDDFVERARAARAVPAQSRAATSSSVLARAATAAAPGRFDRWVVQMQVRIDSKDPAYLGLKAILDSLPDDDARTMLDGSRNMEQLARKLARYSLRQESASAMLENSGIVAALEWRSEDVRGRLQFAAKRREALGLKLASEVRIVGIHQVIRRGTTWMVLGEDVLEGESIAIKLDMIQAFAELPGDMLERMMAGDEDELVDVGVEPDEPDNVVRKPWHPAPGQPPPAGHLPCPCGSGERYRNCCRNAPMA